MSRTVSGVFGTPVATPAYSAGKSQDADTDGTSFGEALDRAQTTQLRDTPKAGTTSPNSRTAGGKSAKTLNGRSKPLMKMVAGKGDGEPSKVQKEVASSTDQELASDVGQEESGEADAEQSSRVTTKQAQKSSLSSEADSSAEDPAAILQLQNAAPDAAVRPVSKLSAKDEPGPKKSAKPSLPKVNASGTTGMPANEVSTDAKTPSEASMSSPNTLDAGENADPASESKSPEAPEASSKSRLAIQPKAAERNSAEPAQTASAATGQQAQALASPIPSGDPTPPAASPTIGPAAPVGRASRKELDEFAIPSVLQQPPSASSSSTAALDGSSAADDSQASSQSSFSDANHPKIVSGITGRLLPNGGAMQIRLDPPELGAMQVRVEMRDGVMTASFETSNDQATRLLSHSLGDLRTALEAQGVSVQKLQVSQSPKQQQSSTSGDGQKDNSQLSQDTAGQREQQRKEMVRRMWQKLMGGQDPVDLMA